jgi:antitoxin PrlF
MPIATVTSKGQITIPAEVRARLGIHTGTRVQFVPDGDGNYGFVPLTGSAAAMKGMFHWSGAPVALDEMDEAIAAGAAETMQS